MGNTTYKQSKGKSEIDVVGCNVVLSGKKLEYVGVLRLKISRVNITPGYGNDLFALVRFE
jgi:hypothetical protein